MCVPAPPGVYLPRLNTRCHQFKSTKPSPLQLLSFQEIWLQFFSVSRFTTNRSLSPIFIALSRRTRARRIHAPRRNLPMLVGALLMTSAACALNAHAALRPVQVQRTTTGGSVALTELWSNEERAVLVLMRSFG